MELKEFSNIGSKIRKERRAKGLSQSDLSKKLEISPSYLNLLESGRRTITVPLLIKIGNELGISLKDLTLESNKRILSDVMEVLSNELFEDLDITNLETNEFISNNPNIAKAMLTLNDSYKSLRDDMQYRLEIMDAESSIKERKSTRLPVEIVSDFLQENKNYFPKLESFADTIFEKIQTNKRTRYMSLCEFIKKEYSITVKDIIPEEGKPFSKIYNKDKKELLMSDYVSLETKKLYAAAQIAQEGAMNEINEYLSKFSFPSEESKKLTKVALLNYCGAAILMPYKLFHEECKKQKYDLELLQNTFATSFEQVAHRVTCLQDPKLPGIPFHMLRVDIAGNISKRFSLSGIEIPRYGGACPRWNIYSAFTTPNKIHAAVSKMTNGEKYVCIARTVEKGVGRYGKSKSMLSIGLGCEAKYAKDFVYTENLNVNDKKTEIPIGVSCRTCDRLDCSQRAFPPLHKKFDVDINSRGVSVYVSD